MKQQGIFWVGHGDGVFKIGRFSEAAQTQNQVMDQFDRLPDSIVLVIFNKVGDIKVLGRCCAVSRRLLALASQVDNVVVKVDCVISGEEVVAGKGRSLLSNLMRLLFGSLVKPLQALQHHLLGPYKKNNTCGATEVSHHSPCEVLRNFRDVKHLRIELPEAEYGVEEGVLLKWKAEFGSTLESCVILGAAALETKGGKLLEEDMQYVQKVAGANTQAFPDDEGSFPESFYNDGGLKDRVVWTISSLIAASRRHYLLPQIISEHPTLQSLVMTDADGQGMLCMGKEQLMQCRKKPPVAAASSCRTLLPDLMMKLWYAPTLTLPSGLKLVGATLAALRPSDPSRLKEDDAFISKAFEEPYKTAASYLAKRRTYLLEMNSF